MSCRELDRVAKKAMELAKWTGLIENGRDLFYIQKPSITEHDQNRNYSSWTYLIDLARDSFDQAIMKKDQKLAEFLLNKWQTYPYSLFYRLILYAVTKHSVLLSEDIVIKLFKEKTDQTLWSSSCKNEVLRYLRERQHSESAIKELLSMIMEAPSKSLFRVDIDENLFTQLKEKAIYERLNWLKGSGVQLPEDINTYYNKIQSKYNISEKKEDSDSFPFYQTGPSALGSKKLFHNLTNKQIFKKIKYTAPNKLPTVDEKREEFRSFLKDFPDRAFDILSMFQDNNINSTPYWTAFIYEVSMMTDAEKSKKWFLKSFGKVEKSNDEFIKKCLGSLTYSLNFKGGLIYSKDKELFKKWWKRLFEISFKDMELFIEDYSDIESIAINSNLGNLSQTVFSMLWSRFTGQKIPKDGKIPEEIKKDFGIILQSEVIKKDPSVLFHFGSHLSRLWYLVGPEKVTNT